MFRAGSDPGGLPGMSQEAAAAPAQLPCVDVSGQVAPGAAAGAQAAARSVAPRSAQGSLDVEWDSRHEDLPEPSDWSGALAQLANEAPDMIRFDGPGGGVTFCMPVYAQRESGVGDELGALCPVLSRHVTFRKDGSCVIGTGARSVGPVFRCTCGTDRRALLRALAGPPCPRRSCGASLRAP
mmetsp:Transcript_9750/g.28602  ORF Transcript_9750/g.28602 Transcript_9750/m.28602 type:complete len:182 (+) Transcript_9750:138-683(+)